MICKLDIKYLMHFLIFIFIFVIIMLNCWFLCHASWENSSSICYNFWNYYLDFTRSFIRRIVNKLYNTFSVWFTDLEWLLSELRGRIWTMRPSFFIAGSWVRVWWLQGSHCRAFLRRSYFSITWTKSMLQLPFLFFPACMYVSFFREWRGDNRMLTSKLGCWSPP